MMANPRKFSEKIALHNQKQAEETAAFEQIMREVMGATRLPSNVTVESYDMTGWKTEHIDGMPNSAGPYQKNHLGIVQSLGAYRGGSLPNVNQISNNSIDLQSALHNLEDMKHGQENYSDRVPRDRGRHAVPHRNRQFLLQKRLDVSPYGSTSYLSPPPDTNWRRTNSDSALHQSAMAPQENVNSANTPPTQRRGTVHEMDSGTLLVDTGQLKDSWDSRDGYLIASFQSRPKSCEVPGINIFPTQDESNILHMPLPNSNTGSLPDLTNLHFPSPLSTPLDAEDQSSASSYGQQTTSPRSSPAHFSPSGFNLQQAHVLGNFSLGSSSLLHSSPLLHGSVGGNLSQGGGAPLNRHSSPVHSPASRRRQSPSLSNLVISGNGSLVSSLHHNHQNLSQSQLGSQVCRGRRDPPPPRITVERCLDNLKLDSVPNSNMYALYGQQPQSPSHHQQNYAPQSPTLPQVSVGTYRSASPSEHSCSAPTSPVSHISPVSSPGLGPPHSKSPFTDTGYFLHQQQTSVLQSQLEQFKMVAESPPLTHNRHPSPHHQHSPHPQSSPHSSMQDHQREQQQQQQQQQQHDQYIMMHNNGPVCTTSSPTTPPSPGVYLAGLGGGGCGPPRDITTTTTTSQLMSNHNGIGGQPLNCVNTTGLENSLYYDALTSSSDAFTESPSYYSKSPSGVISCQTPQTPTGIPDIILTAPDQISLRHDFAKDIGSAIGGMSGSFDSDIFSSEEVMRASGLPSIDFEGLNNILSDAELPSVIADSVGDDSFQLDHS